MNVSFLYRTYSIPASRSGGFALVELLIAIGILVLVLSAVMVNQSNFNSAVLIENQAYEVAFDIRQTQLQAVSAQAGLDGDFYQSYRIDFTQGDRLYEVSRVSGTDSPVRIGAPQQLDRRFTVQAIRHPGQDAAASHDEVAIQFTRPNFDALFFDEDGNEMDEDAIQIFLCDTGGSSERAEQQRNRVQNMSGGQNQDLRFDLNNDGSVDGGDVAIINNLGCFYRMVEVSNTGQITVR